jgi:hypothetical protein
MFILSLCPLFVSSSSADQVVMEDAAARVEERKWQKQNKINQRQPSSALDLYVRVRAECVGYLLKREGKEGEALGRQPTN